MAKKTSAGMLLYRIIGDNLEVFLVHPGGSCWAKRDDGSWSIPKGLFEAGEDPLEAAKSECLEVDRGGWFRILQAREKLLKGQTGFLEELQKKFRNELKERLPRLLRGVSQ
ncbi:MAG: NUDIX domain-containing protein [Smithella sp.]|jgi:predicted NUDIX family NTP pyrophosphohydrolase